MISKVLSMPEIFSACREILDTTLRPWHYRDLTQKALELLDIPIDEIALDKQCEDIREKMLQARWKNTVFYLGQPYCLGAVIHWFQQGFNLEPWPIPVDVRGAIDGTYEALMRPMIQKKANAAKGARMMAKARGMVIEGIVRHYFQETWPTLYLPPDNHQQWNRPCDHDFKLKLNDNSVARIDISGPDKNGNYGNQADKKSTDLHFICDLTGDGRIVEWLAAAKGSDYIKNLIPEHCISPLQIIVWLNCLSADLPYKQLQQASYGLC